MWNKVIGVNASRARKIGLHLCRDLFRFRRPIGWNKFKRNNIRVNTKLIRHAFGLCGTYGCRLGLFALGF